MNEDERLPVPVRYAKPINMSRGCRSLDGQVRDPGMDIVQMALSSIKATPLICSNTNRMRSIVFFLEDSRMIWIKVEWMS